MMSEAVVTLSRLKRNKYANAKRIDDDNGKAAENPRAGEKKAPAKSIIKGVNVVERTRHQHPQRPHCPL
ncbi:hypothetical protein Pelo_19479 [Pelomyxa schiedti]|nr:hypothetical protein Pelo_19479 [Pelomyxa schiedti]